ncbi:MAG: DUF362 domain-containing protein [Candidatus Riflebacteria bacterium]|nr:DUF362 domain-containing protein [Candidatus Riflebacteria bacterium]
MSKAKVAVLKTRPETVIDDYHRLMNLANYKEIIAPGTDTLIKLNLSWTKYFPSCSSQPWQLDGVLGAFKKDGYDLSRLFPVENKTVVTNPRQGFINNRWKPVLDRFGLPFIPLPEVEWTVHKFQSKLLKLNQIFPDGIEIPKMYIGKQIVHLPTVKTHGHSITTGAIKNAFGGLLKEVRHFAHEFIHEVLVDLLAMQREIHPSVLAVMDGTVCGNGAGPRTMIPVDGNVILASADQVAIDSVAARIMGFDPRKIPYLEMAAQAGFGVNDPAEIELVGDDVSGMNLGFEVARSLVIWGDQLIRKGPLKPLERLLLKSPLFFWAPLASNIYHDWIWYPTIGRARIRRFSTTPWGRLYEQYLAS